MLDAQKHDEESGQDNDMRALDLVVDGRNISQYVGGWASCEEKRGSWTLHTEFPPNDSTSAVMRPLVDKTVPVRFRLRVRDSNDQLVLGPWRSGQARVNWRFTKAGDEELILSGVGSLKRSDRGTKPRSVPQSATITRETTVGGRVVEREQGEVTITFVGESKEQKALREAFLKMKDDSEVRALTDPSFVLFLANSARSAYRLLFETGLLEQRGELVFAAQIFLPLAIEYEMKYLLHRQAGEIKDEYKTHKLLKLFDFLAFDLQEAVDREFKNELESIGRERTSQNLRLFLRRTESAFTALRYLFDPAYARDNRHLLQAESTAMLTCVSNALERVVSGTNGPP